MLSLNLDLDPLYVLLMETENPGPRWGRHKPVCGPVNNAILNFSVLPVVATTNYDALTFCLIVSTFQPLFVIDQRIGQFQRGS